MAPANYLSPRRLEALVDGVFAIAMTLLAFDLKVPEIAAAFVNSQLQLSVFALWPRVIIYFISFVTLGFYWVGHHIQYNYIKYSDRVALWINLFFLMFVALIPFTTGVLGRYPDSQFSIILYGANIVIIGLIVNLHWWYATVRHRLTEHEISPKLVSMSQKRTLVGPCLAFLAILISFMNMTASIVLFAIIPVYYILPASIDSFWRRPAVPHSHEKQ